MHPFDSALRLSALRRVLRVLFTGSIAAICLQATTVRAQSAPRLDNQTPHFPPVSPVRSRTARPPAPRQAPPTGHNTGMPFGVIGPREIDGFERYVKKTGVDLFGDVRLAYAGDEAALGRVFAFSVRFDRLDQNARTYGQIVYSAMLNLSEQRGRPWFSRIVAAQPPAIRQRVRDFLFYDATQAPKPTRAAAEATARHSAPDLFPADYVFGTDNPLFTHR